MVKPERGVLHILNAGAGDLRITFRPDETAEEMQKAQTMIESLLRQGYALLVEDADGRYSRATGWDPEARAYIVKDTGASSETISEPKAKAPKKKKAARRKKRVAASSARAVAVARSAGG